MEDTQQQYGSQRERERDVCSPCGSLLCGWSRPAAYTGSVILHRPFSYGIRYPQSSVCRYFKYVVTLSLQPCPSYNTASTNMYEYAYLWLPADVHTESNNSILRGVESSCSGGERLQSVGWPLPWKRVSYLWCFQSCPYSAFWLAGWLAGWPCPKRIVYGGNCVPPNLPMSSPRRASCTTRYI